MAPHNRPLIGAIDQGTSSSRFLVFELTQPPKVVAEHQIQIKTEHPHEGWAEQDPLELLSSVQQCITVVYDKLKSMGLESNLKAVGITNQRETTVVWDRATGQPLYDAIVWLDGRTEATVDNILTEKAGNKGKDVLRDICGLPISTYFSAVKLRWLLDHVEHVREAADAGQLMFGTVDSWLIYNLTGGVNGGKHVTDVTNASRTMLMNLETMAWDDKLLDFFGISKKFLPEIKSSAEVYGNLSYGGCEWSVPIAGCLGDQQAALVGHQCFQPGTAKNTYGTGCFMLFNVGEKIVKSGHGLLSTVGYQLGPEAKPVFALEGSIAMAGAAVKWLETGLGVISKPPEVEVVAKTVEDNGGVYFVPAFSGLFAPHWRSDARGVICGLSQYSNKGHICRATLEAICFQTKEIVECMRKDSGISLKKMLVDGAMTKNDLLMQTQSDFLDIDVLRPQMVEVTALGAAYAAGKAVGVWFPEGAASEDGVKTFKSEMEPEMREKKFGEWKKAVVKCLGKEPYSLNG